jgi:phosphoenolpyruvate-protein kinase (PTS system EI component)
MANIMDEEKLRALLTDLWELFERVFDLDESLQGLVDLLGERVGADLHIMFPMVSSVDEIEMGREEVERCIADLSRESIRRFSVAPSRIPVLRHRIGNTTIEDAQRISSEMLGIRSIRDMEQYVELANAPVA